MGTVFEDSFNKAYRDEDILSQIYLCMMKSNYARIFIIMIFIFHNIKRKCMCIMYVNSLDFMSFFLKSSVFNDSQNVKSSNELPKCLLFIYLVYNAAFITKYHANAVQDDIFSKTVSSDCITLQAGMVRIQRYTYLYYFCFTLLHSGLNWSDSIFWFLF